MNPTRGLAPARVSPLARLWARSPLVAACAVLPTPLPESNHPTNAPLHPWVSPLHPTFALPRWDIAKEVAPVLVLVLALA